MDGEEGGGGGKLKHTVVRKHTNKPYDRPKSFLRRGLDAIKSFVHQAIAPSFLQPPMSPSSVDGLNDDFAEPQEAEHSSVNGGNPAVTSASAVALSPADVPLSRAMFATPSSPFVESSDHYRSLSLQRTVTNNECNRSWKAGGSNHGLGSSRNYPNIGLDIASSSSAFQTSKDGLADDHSECSDNSVSTSGCSSLIPHPDKRDYQKEFLNMSDASLKNLASKLSESTPTARPPLHAGSASTSRKQLSVPNSVSKISLEQHLELDTSKFNNHTTWSEENNYSHALPQPRAAGNKPAFNVSAFGSPIWSEKSILNDSTSGSPFYSGKTIFGGASASKRSIVHVSSPYMPSNLAKRQKVNVKTVETDVNNVEIMSSTARRILDTLEKMSTPVQDAKKIPTNSSFMDSPLSFTPSPSQRRPNLASMKLNTSLSRGPPVAKVLTPAFASVATNLQNRLPKDVSDGLKRARECTSQMEVVHSLTNTLTSDVRSRVGGKMASSRRDVQHYSSKSRREDLENVEPLPISNVPLPITTLPNFQLGKSASASTSAKSHGEFTFSIPSVEESIPLSSGEVDQSRVDEFVFHPPKDSGAFSSPISTTSSVLGSQKSTSPASFKFQFPKTTPKLVKKPYTETSESSPGGFTAATELKSGSVMDILGKSSAVVRDPVPAASSAPSLLEKFKPAAGTWECPICMIRNKAETLKCAACETPKPGPAASACHTSTTKPANGKTALLEKFKPAAGSWECPTCMIRNKAEILKCTACETPKPGPAASAHYTSTNKPANALLEKFKPAAGSWECPTCMIRNKAEILKCAACETPKPGPAASAHYTSTNKPANDDFSHNKNKRTRSNTLETQGRNEDSMPSNTFGDKFMPSPDTWECDMCMVRNKNNVKKCIACNTPRTTSLPSTATVAVLSSTTSSAFKMPTSAVMLTTTSASASSDFKFGGTTTVGSSNFKFGFDSSNTNSLVSKTKSNTQKPEFTSSFSTDSAGKSSTISTGFKFGVSKPSSNIGASGMKFGFGASKLTEANAMTTTVNTVSAAVTTMSTSSAVSNNCTTQKSSQDVKLCEQATEKNLVDDASPPAKQIATSLTEKESSSTNASSGGGFKFPLFDTTSKATSVSEELKKDKEQSGTGGGFQFPKVDTASWNASNAATSTEGSTAGGFIFNANATVSGNTTSSGGFVFPKPENNAGTSAGGFTFSFATPKQPLENKDAAVDSGTPADGESSSTFVLNKTSSTGIGVATTTATSSLVPMPLMFCSTAGSNSSTTTTTTSNGLPFTFGSQLPVSTTPSIFGNVEASVTSASTTKEQSSFLPTTSSVFSSPASSNVIQPSTNTGSIFGAAPAPTTVASGGIFGKLAATTTASGVFGTTSTTTTGNIFGSATAITTIASSNFFSPPITVACTTASLPTFGTFQAPVTTATTSASLPAFGSSTGFSFGNAATTSAFSGFGSTGNSTFKTVTTTASVQAAPFSTIPVFTTTPSPFSTGGITTGTTVTSSTGNLFAFNSSTTGTSNIFGSGSSGFAPTTTTAASLPFNSVSAFGASNQPAGFGSFTSPNPTSSTPAPAAAPFTFGSTTGGNFNSGSTFQFGGSQASSGLFTFTGNQNNAQPDQASAVMAFGSQNPSAAPSPAPASAFPAVNMAPAFNFNTNSNVGPNPFQFSAGPQNAPQSGPTSRLFRRAVRRNRK